MMHQMLLFCLSVALFAQHVHSHYIFSKLIVNSSLSEDFQYTRDVLTSGGMPLMFGKSFPLWNLSHPDIICGRSAFPVRNPSIQTATVLAGDEVSFHVSGPYYEGDTQPYIFHNGPGQVFLSKLPEGLSDLKDYDGSADFFKIAYAGPANSSTWSLYGALEMRFQIPARTPPGKYLMRIEQFMPTSKVGESQWYISCAHVDILGAGGGIPGPVVKFPNAYTEEDPGIWFRDEVTGYIPKNISTYIELKPSVWKG